MDKALTLLEWKKIAPANLEVNPLCERRVREEDNKEGVKNPADILIAPEDIPEIEKNWVTMKSKNPKLFAGDTLRLAGRHWRGEKLVISVIPCNYRLSSACYGWIGCAMVPVTSDGLIAMQGHVDGVAVTIGGGVRVPGCTPKTPDMIGCVIQEMHEEFNVEVDEKNLEILGIIEARPPVARLHQGLTVQVNLGINHQQLVTAWKEAEDKWEGELEFVDPHKLGTIVKKGELEKYNPQSRLILARVIDNMLGTDCVASWCHRGLGPW